MSDKNIEYKQFDFDIVKSAMQVIINKRDFNEVNFELLITHVVDELKLICWKDWVGKRQQKTITFYEPKTWKDHFKNTYRHNRLMKWWIKRHPIQAKAIKFTLNKIHVFPEVKVPDKPEFMETYSYLETSNDDSHNKRVEIK